MTDTRPRHASVAASPWVIDTRAMGLTRRQGPGSSHPLDLVAPAPEQTGTTVLTVPEGADVHVTGLLESVSEGVLATGTAATTADGSCARCLRDISVPVSARFRELFAYPESTTAATTGDDEVPRLAGDFVDLQQLVHDELVLAMPLAPVCSPDCPGLCPECGEPMDAVGPVHRHDRLDPRWAALEGLLEAGSDDRTDPAEPGMNAGDTEEK